MVTAERERFATLRALRRKRHERLWLLHKNKGYVSVFVRYDALTRNHCSELVFQCSAATHSPGNVPVGYGEIGMNERAATAVSVTHVNEVTGFFWRGSFEPMCQKQSGGKPNQNAKADCRELREMAEHEAPYR